MQNKLLMQNSSFRFTKTSKILSKIVRLGSIRMSVVPQGAFMAKKIRQNDEKKLLMSEKVDLSPPKYSSKFMNSIWGMYNRYSVHNLKKIMDEKKFTVSAKENQSLETSARSLSTNNLLTGFL